MAEESMITFRYLNELKKKEKESPQLQEIDSKFYGKVADYVARKKRMQEQKSDFGSEDDESAKIMAMIQNIFNIREAKILKAAEVSAKTGMKVPTMLPEEKILFHSVKNGLLENRKLLKEVLEGKTVKVELSDTSAEEQKQANASTDSSKPDWAQPLKPEGERDVTRPKTEYVKLRILESIPAFVAENLDNYGPWPKNAEVSCPKMAAEMFVKQGKAERID